MCLSIPGRVAALEDACARVLIGGRERRAETLLVPEVAVGDYVLVAGDLIVDLLSEEEATLRLSLFDEIEDIAKTARPDDFNHCGPPSNLPIE